MKAIFTKFHGPSLTRGSRVSATDRDGNRLYRSYDHALSPQDNHDAAMQALCARMGWTGHMVRGDVCGAGCVYVWSDGRETISVYQEEHDRASFRPSGG